MITSNNYVTVAHGVGVSFAVLMVWQPIYGDADGEYRMDRQGKARKDRAKAEEDAKEMARKFGVEVR